jgi:hypothetical protein
MVIQGTSGLGEAVEQVDWENLAKGEADAVAVERLFVLVLATLCLDNESEAAAGRIGLLGDCTEPFKSTLSHFLESKVFRLLDEKGETHLSPLEARQFSGDMEWSAVKSTTSVPRDEVGQLLDQIKAGDKTIARLEAELHEAQTRLEIESERAADLGSQLQARESEISRLTEELGQETEAVGQDVIRP